MKQRADRKNSCRKWQGSVILLMLLIGTAAGPGCVKLMQQNSQDNISRGITTPTQTSLEDTSGTPAGTHSISQIPDLATDALPELTPDPYPAQHALQFNTTTDPSRYVRAPEFKRTYVLRGNSTGLVVNATSLKGPLWISFDVKPLYDCLENPESCRGDKTKSVNRPYFTITVRDNRTREIVAEDGYAREYSSQKDNRTMKIYGEGRYHITMTGESVDVTLYIATGNAPAPSATQASAASSAQESDIPPELREMLYGGL